MDAVITADHRCDGVRASGCHIDLLTGPPTQRWPWHIAAGSLPRFTDNLYHNTWAGCNKTTHQFRDVIKLKRGWDIPVTNYGTFNWAKNCMIQGQGFLSMVMSIVRKDGLPTVFSHNKNSHARKWKFPYRKDYSTITELYKTHLSSDDSENCCKRTWFMSLIIAAFITQLKPEAKARARSNI